MIAYSFSLSPLPLPLAKADERTVKRIVHLTILLALWFSFALSLIDHHAAERDPWHRHVVLGGSPGNFTQILASHRHVYEQPHHHDWDQLPQQAPLVGKSSLAHADHHGDEPQVIAVQNLDGAGVSLLGSFGKALLTSGWLMLALLPPLLVLGRIAPSMLPLQGIVLPIPNPPPRRSLLPSPSGR